MMKKHKRIFAHFGVCLIIIACFAQNAQAQMLPERVQVEAEKTTIDKIEIDDTLINRNNVAICNDNEQDIKILIGENLPPADTFLVKGNSIWYSRTYSQNKIFISIQTGENIIRYTLIPGKAYLICWNDNKEYWYLKKLYRN
jgi:hypothetical protein